MSESWAVEETQTADLGDKRLNERLGEVLSQLGAFPSASIPAACGGEAEMTAAYRLFDNAKTSFEAVLAPHVDATRRRMAARPRVLLVHDTTELDLTRPAEQVAGTGPLGSGARRGFFLHPLLAFTPDGTPLGTLGAMLWTRDEVAEPVPARAQRDAQRKRTPIEEKESMRWLETLRRARAEARRTPDTRLVCVADSEADIYEGLVEAQADPPEVEWIVRSGQDRAVKRTGAGPAPRGRLRHAVLEGPVLFTHTVTLRARQAKLGCTLHGRAQTRAARTASVGVRAAGVVLRPPYRPDRSLPAVALNAVLVYEADPPPDAQPVDWLLLTNLPIDTHEGVREVIRFYCARWLIEVFFRTLKSGCRVEQRRFEHLDRLYPCLAVYLIVAWRTLYVCRLGRACPDLSCEALFEPDEWKPVYRVVRGAPPPALPPRLQEMVRIVAQLGGYVPRKANGEPGPQTVWLGLQRMHDMALCWRAFGPEAKDV